MRKLQGSRVATALVGVLFSITLGWSDDADAACVGEPPRIIWSYPEGGATNVPTNATIWLYMNGFGTNPAGAPTLNGVALEAGDLPYTYATPELTPNTDYVLNIQLPVLLDGGSGESEMNLEFRTGQGQVDDQPALGAVNRARTIGSGNSMDGFYRPDGGAIACQELFSANDCFDVGNTSIVELGTGDSPLGWLFEVEYAWEIGNADLRYEPRMHPAGCGAPRVPVLADAEEYCIDLRGIFAGGVASAPVRYCASQSFPDASTDGAVSSPPDAGIFDAAVDGALSTPPEAGKPTASSDASTLDPEAGGDLPDASQDDSNQQDASLSDGSTEKPEKHSKDSGCAVSNLGEGKRTMGFSLLLLASLGARLRRRRG